METNSIVVLGVVAVVVGSIVYFFKQKINTTVENKEDFDLSKACSSIDLTKVTSENIDNLQFEEIIKWFQSMGLKKGQHIPFVLINLPNEIVKEEYSALFLGIFDTTCDEIQKHDLIYYKETDAKVKDMLSHAENGIVVLG